MTASYSVLVIIFVALATVFAYWRISSRRSIPCPSWLSWLVELDNPLFRNNRAAVIIDHLDLREGMSALDVGCGPGRLSIPMAIKVGPRGHVAAVDSQLGMLERAKERSVKARVTNIRFLQGEIGTGNLKLDRFDRTVLVTVLGEMQHPGDALREIFAALKPGGLLAITEVIADPHFQDQRTVRELASAAGFREKAVIGGRYSYSLYFMKPGEESGGGLN